MISLRLKEGSRGIQQRWWSSSTSLLQGVAITTGGRRILIPLHSGSSRRWNVRNGHSFMTNPARVRTEQRRRRDASGPELVALKGEGKRVERRSYFGRTLPISRPKWLRA